MGVQKFEGQPRSVVSEADLAAIAGKDGVYPEVALGDWGKKPLNPFTDRVHALPDAKKYQKPDLIY